MERRAKKPGKDPLFALHTATFPSIQTLPMSPFVCEQCGGDLRLSLTDRAYLCESSPRDHRFDRGEVEQAWLKQAAAQVEKSPGDVDAVFQLASLCGRLASTSLRVGDPDPARVYMSQVVAVIELLHRDKPDDERVRAMLMEALVEQATFGEKLNDRAMALGAYERLLPFLRAQAEADAKNIDLQRNLSTCLNGAGRMSRALGNGVAARTFFEQDLVVLDHLQELYPEQSDLTFDRAVARFNLYLVSDVRAEELEHLEATLAILEKAPKESMPEKARQLLQRVMVERERIASTDPLAPSRLAVATAQAAQDKVEEPKVAADRRAWLIEQVDLALRARRKRLLVVR